MGEDDRRGRLAEVVFSYRVSNLSFAWIGWQFEDGA